MQKLRKRKLLFRFSGLRTHREDKDARTQEVPRDRADSRRQEEQEWIRKREKDTYLPRREGATITVRQETETKTVREEIFATETVRVREETAIKTAREEKTSVTEETATETVRAEDQEIIKTETARAGISAIKTVREEEISATEETATETARAEIPATEEIVTETVRAETRYLRVNNGPSIPAPMVAEQKPQRRNQKDNYKKKDYDRDDEREGRFGQKQGKGRKNQQPVMEKPQPKQEKKEEQIKQITIPKMLTIKELADAMKIQPSAIVKKLFLQGKIVTVNQEIDFDTAEEIAMEFDVLCEQEEEIDVIEELLKEEEEDEKKMKKRPPVVCVMGHVDHGKTSLLDAIRHTNVTDREAGGITQHIGASVVNINGESITFLDTPGHEAFTAMRLRGACSTDIAVLVVAADDGVMPQTVEAINHAKAAGVEIVVAINKIDKPSANIERVKQELTEYELIPEDWGGSTIFVPVSAHTKEGIPELLEMILLTAEMLELKANPNRRARGLVIEAQLDKGKGPVATVLVQKGTLRVGDAIAAGSAFGKVRAMMDDKGRRVKEAGPSMPVEILGFNDVPNAGEVFVVSKNEKEARNFAETFISQNRMKMLEETKSKMSLDDLFNQIKEGNLKELDIVVKADVQGSVEAMKQSLLKLSNDEVVVKVIHGGVGAINESDVMLASASNAIIIGFNVRPDAAAKETAERENVDVRLYRVIYNAIEDVEAA